MMMSPSAQGRMRPDEEHHREGASSTMRKKGSHGLSRPGLRSIYASHPINNGQSRPSSDGNST
jgi:hypothetical protein